MKKIANLRVILDTDKTNLLEFEKIISKVVSVIDEEQKKYPDMLEHIEVEIKA